MQTASGAVACFAILLIPTMTGSLQAALTLQPKLKQKDKKQKDKKNRKTKKKQKDKKIANTNHDWQSTTRPDSAAQIETAAHRKTKK